MDTKDMLVKALTDFDGTMLFVSHDRQFLSRLSNRVLRAHPEGQHVYARGYSEYVARAATKPRRELSLLPLTS